MRVNREPGDIGQTDDLPICACENQHTTFGKVGRWRAWSNARLAAEEDASRAPSGYDHALSWL
jgi:hypothetical protein